MNEVNVTNNMQEREEEPSITLRDIFCIVVNKWYWFVLSAMVCLAVATVYLMWAPKVYERTATVLIKDIIRDPAKRRCSRTFRYLRGKVT